MPKGTYLLIIAAGSEFCLHTAVGTEFRLHTVNYRGRDG